MRITIIPDDSVVIVDGVPRNFSFTVDANIHAVQWNGESGHIEQKVGGIVPISHMDDFDDVLDAYTAAAEVEGG